ncbi:MAG: AraC family transcriptional regulator [Bacteroidota bacterium]
MPRFTFSLADIIGLIIIYQSLFFSINLHFQKEKTRAFNQILSILSGLFALNFSNILLINQGVWGNELNFGLVYGFLYGPVFYLYALYLMEQEEQLNKRHYVHVLPSCIVLVYILATGNPIRTEWRLMGLTLFVLVHIFLYLGKSYLAILSFQKRLKDNFSEIESRKLSWLKSLIISITFILFFSSLEAFFPNSYEPFYVELYFVLISLFALMMINFMFYKGLRYPEILGHQLLESPKRKYQGSNLSKEGAEHTLKKLDHFMIREKPYLNEELSIRELAALLEVPAKHLSQVINENKSMNFFDFINEFRIEEACTLLRNKTSSEMRINEIMYQVGFRSKSTFNQVFKLKVGMTPKAYRLRHIK